MVTGTEDPWEHAIYEADDPRGPSDFALAMGELKRRPPALFGLLVVGLVLVMAIIPGQLAPLDPLEKDLIRFMQPPGYVDDAGRPVRQFVGRLTARCARSPYQTAYRLILHCGGPPHAG